MQKPNIKVVTTEADFSMSDNQYRNMLHSEEVTDNIPIPAAIMKSAILKFLYKNGYRSGIVSAVDSLSDHLYISILNTKKYSILADAITTRIMLNPDNSKIMVDYLYSILLKYIKELCE